MGNEYNINIGFVDLLSNIGGSIASKDTCFLGLETPDLGGLANALIAGFVESLETFEKVGNLNPVPAAGGTLENIEDGVAS